MLQDFFRPELLITEKDEFINIFENHILFYLAKTGQYILTIVFTLLSKNYKENLEKKTIYFTKSVSPL